MIKAVIFDCDGVILDSADIKTKAFRKLFLQYPDKVDQIVDYHIQNMGVSRYVKFRHIYKDILGLPLPAEEEKRLGNKFSEIALNEILNTPFIPGAFEFISLNYKKFSLFIASGTPQEELDLIVDKRKISPYFKEIWGSPPSKNEITADILSRNPWTRKEVVFVGDSDTDLKVAEDVGIAFIARVPKGSLTLKDCSNRVNDLAMLENLLSRMN